MSAQKADKKADKKTEQKALVKNLNAPALALHEITRSFTQGGQTIEVLRGVTFVVRPGEMVALVGPSGAGKSTMLQIAGLLEPPTGGEVYIDGKKCSKLNDGARTRVRRKRLGFVYQHHHLLPEFTARENVMIPQIVNGLGRREARNRAEDLLKMVGLGDRTTHRPAELSGGQQQRVAIARALANAPALLLADEPTGNLDAETAERVFVILKKLVHEVRLAAVIATHNLDLAARMDRVLVMKNGVVREA